MSDRDAPATDPDARPVDTDELDFTNHESVVEIGESRYVVGTDGQPNTQRMQPESQPTSESGFAAADLKKSEKRQSTDSGSSQGNRNGDATGVGTSQEASDGLQEGMTGQPRDPSPTSQQNGRNTVQVDRQVVSRWLANSFDGDGFTYGIDATLHVDGNASRQRMVSNDVTATFDTLVTWFASNAGPSSPTPEAIGLLLAASETTVDLQPVVIKRVAASQGLSASDSIGDLVRAAEKEGGFRVE